MKYVELFESWKNLKVNETGEWDRHIDLEYVENNPDANDEFSSWIRYFKSELDKIKGGLNNPDEFEISNIKGFDKYQGPYANVKIKGYNYTIWTHDHDLLFIENYPVVNTSENQIKGFIGTVDDIIELLNK